MALIKADRVKETSTSTGTGTFALAGAATGYRTFSSVCAIGDTFYYAISNQSNGEWESGLGTYSAANTLTRTTVHASSNSGNAVTFSAGTKEVFLTLTARHLDRIQDNGQSTAIGSKTSVVAVNDSATLPDLDLQFADLKTLTAKYGPTPSYSRASTGTYFNASGVLTSAAVNEPRFDHVFENGAWVSKGLLIEEQRTNICSWSEQLNDASWNFKTNITVSANFGNAPDGNATADLIYPTANGSSCEIGKSVGTVNTSLVHTNSFYLKSSGKTWAKILSIRGAFGAWFNLSNGTVGTVESGASATIQNVGNGWYRCTVSRAPIDFATGYSFVLVCDSDNSSAVTASGTNGILVWGAQTEVGSFATSYTGTTSSSVTRSADVCQITGSAFTNLWNATEGSFASEVYPVGNNAITNQAIISANDGTFANVVGHMRNIMNTNGDYGAFVRNSSVTQVQISRPAASMPAFTSSKAAFGFKLNDFADSLNGVSPLTDTSGTIPTILDRFTIGDFHTNANTYFNGCISRIRYFRSRLDNTQLVNLSGGINTLAFKTVTGSGSVTVANEYSNINVSVPNPLPITNGGTGAQTQLNAVTNLVGNPPNDGGQYTLASKKTSGTPTFYWVDGTGYAPTLDLLFAADKSLTAYKGPTPSFSRASTGTFFNSSGVLTSAAINAPRFNHTFNGTSWVSRGLLVEEQRTNLALRSDKFATSPWISLDSTVTENAANGPDGLNSSSKIIPNTSNTFHGVYQLISTSALTYTLSFYSKADGYNFAHIFTGSTTDFVAFNLSSGTVSSSDFSGGKLSNPQITGIGNGWYRCSVNIAAAAASSSFGVLACETDNAVRLPSFAGNGTSGILVFGFQLELGSFPTSYIPTTSASATRSADVCQITGTSFSSFWNASEGSFAVEADSFSTSVANQYMATASDGTNNNRIQLARSANNTITDSGFFVFNGGSAQAFLTVATGSWPLSAVTKHASCYKANDFAYSFNGTAVLTDTSGTIPTVNNLTIGDTGISGLPAPINGHIARLRYYPVRLPNATLQVLST